MGDMKIGEGKKYDATQVSAEGLTQEEIAELTKKNKRLIKIFQAYDTDGKAGLSSTEIAAAMDDFIKAAGEDKKLLEVDNMQKEIERRTQELQKCLAELERKKRLSNNRTAFILALDQLEEAGMKLNERADFDSTLYKLRFIDISTSYSGNEIFAISNSFVLSEFVEFMKEKIKTKIEEIETLLMAD